MNYTKTIYVIHIEGNIANAHTNKAEAEACLNRVEKAGEDVSRFRISEITLYEYEEANQSSLRSMPKGNVSDSGIEHENASDLHQVSEFVPNRDSLEPQYEMLEHYTELKRDALNRALNLKKEDE